MRFVWRGSVKRRMSGAGDGAVEYLHQMARLGFGFGGGIGAELDHEPSATFREQRKPVEINAFAAAGVDDDVVETFEADGAVLHDLRDVVGANEDVGPPDDEEDAAGGLWTRRQVASRIVTQVPSEPTRRGRRGSRFPGAR